MLQKYYKKLTTKSLLNKKKSHKMIKKLAVNLFLLPSFIVQTNLNCFAQTKPSYFNNYTVINATTLTEHTGGTYTGELNEQTHLITTSAIKKALIEEGIDASAIEILLYYDWMFINDNLSSVKWDSKYRSNTISSPWLELTKTVSDSGETKIVIRIDATYARLINDLFSEPDDKYKMNSFLGIPSVQQTCFEQMTENYQAIKLSSEELTVSKVPNSFNCAPEELRKPLLSLFKSSSQEFSEPFLNHVAEELDSNCQDAARQYYEKLYPRLAVRALRILNNEFNSDLRWWREIVKQTKPIEKCR